MTSGIHSTQPVVFDCAGESLVGMVHPAFPGARLGVLVVVGGPQYRVGSHRQFALIARALASSGFPAMRFDHRGIGDSDGGPRSFDAIEADIMAALRQFRVTVPSLEGIVLFGLCDAASAILIADLTEDPVVGLVLVNPWVRTPVSEANTYLRHYYGARVRQPAFWLGLLRGKVRLGRSLRSFLSTRRLARDGLRVRSEAFVDRMREGIDRCSVPVLLITSGRDLVASEFLDLCDGNEHWRSSVGRLRATRVHLTEADHTLSARSDLEAAVVACRQWLEGLSGDAGCTSRRIDA